MLVSCSKLILAVALQRTEGNLGACFLPHCRQQVCVVYGAMRAVGGEDRGAHVSADLRFAQCTRLAAACLALQRGRAAVPPRMPAADHTLSSLH
jgi:hypothetical protein